MSNTKNIITITAVAIAALVFIKKLMWPIIKRYFLNEKLYAGAVLLTVEPTGISINKQQQLILQLQVEPDHGKNFVTEIKALFDEAEIAALQPGARMWVSYNAHYHKKISLRKEELKNNGTFFRTQQ
ncbi:hypothetical protein [Ferruginibacter sp. HRS2-29]|uniref:hypothetical protein n=1 Tax=Ferruginibacter sp. HRS2-29 TaxID=2487334 RepID=UPI0020CDEBD2|nr:hypothetical protein [Ferruginibacter sp. HRS2-29]MCP9750114.1 hypothetical protein [Ferruginibacter sp. HRS2-29]